MEFTTHFELYSQTTRLRGKHKQQQPVSLWACHPLEAWVLSIETQPPATATGTTPNTTGPARQLGQGIRCWASPASLAVTEGILVSFFSSAY